ncbi:hypothetical protein [Acidomonas methanolica]|uniref:DUF4398 domain-containing protein n=1 Tax=Acidomonas methanolica NBRC 104435 TaxID=1231351 RepID=A0A023D2E2_ACIMT|nr:hypothetical protein [Acidomonas methanolica]MBU2652871.1 hypothetical protein [Acidomonas methanolica]TCS31275.1 hypothetical protein EDC31_103118 [Acidomonas methanolica]GAJ27986.1 hypothetical protein Amme_011_086 [Acidomonas methanolica NBRC 104435]GBQ47521.1 hypothetical protein AA0498_0549 [Acidomonas methanolica]GEK98477.1 hypothetical protein AME01nite_09760 [Acidomonas methanolica NBRC 104435]
MTCFRILLPAFALLSLSACATQGRGDLMASRTPDTLLTSYLVATGMVEHRLVARIAARQATRQDVDLAVAVDHNAWTMVRRAILQPSPENMRRADDSLRQLLQQAPEPSPPAAALPVASP